MSSFRMENGVMYTMFNGVPHKLVTETKEVEGGFTVTAKYVPAKLDKVEHE